MVRLQELHNVWSSCAQYTTDGKKVDSSMRETSNLRIRLRIITREGKLQYLEKLISVRIDTETNDDLITMHCCKL